ncbi:hypothetical protein Leryth_014460, partial [Lithospermum erythrorhizon]
YVVSSAACPAYLQQKQQIKEITNIAKHFSFIIFNKENSPILHMAKSRLLQLKHILSVLMIALVFTCAISQDEVVDAPTVLPNPDGDIVESPVSGAIPAPGIDSPESPVFGANPAPAVKSPVDAKATSAPVETHGHPLTFFMHDILGGSQPTAVAVTGVVANPAVSGQVAFAKPNGAVLSVNTGVETNNGNSAILNNNNVPFLSGLSGFTNAGVQNNGNSIIGGNFGFPAINLAQFPTGTTLQNLMFGTMTVFDDELTEGHELGSGLIGKAQGFYVASSQSGNSQTMIFNVMFREGGYADTLCLFGVHRTGKSESHLAVMGGTGKYVNAKGSATVKTFPADPSHQMTDGMETVLEISVYLAY